MVLAWDLIIVNEKGEVRSIDLRSMDGKTYCEITQYVKEMGTIEGEFKYKQDGINEKFVP